MARKLEKSRYTIPGFLAIMLFSSFYVLFDWRWSTPSIMLICMATAAYMMLIRNGRLTLRITFFHVWMLLFSVYCFLSAVWAWDPVNAVTKGTSVFSMFLCYSMVYLCFQEYDSVGPLLKAVMWGGVVVMMVIFGTYGISGVLRILEYDDRLSEQFFLNSNTVGVLCAMSVVVNFYFMISEKRLHWWNLFLVVGILIISATGSRQALALMAGGLVLAFFLTGIQGKSPVEIAVMIAVGIVLAVGMLILFSKLPAFSGIYKRMVSMVSAVTGVGKTDRSAKTRLALIHAGMIQFRNNPLLGIGMGGGHLVAWKYVDRGYYLHNNYVEILSGGGLIGFFTYYSVYVWLLGSFYRFRRYATAETMVCVTLLVMILVEDYAHVTYYAKDTYFYFMICSLEVEKLRRACLTSIPTVPVLQEDGRCLI